MLKGTPSEHARCLENVLFLTLLMLKGTPIEHARWPQNVVISICRLCIVELSIFMLESTFCFQI